MSDGRPFIATGRHDAGRSKIGSEPMTWWNLMEIIINRRRQPAEAIRLGHFGAASGDFQSITLSGDNVRPDFCFFLGKRSPKIDCLYLDDLIEFLVSLIRQWETRRRFGRMSDQLVK